MAFHLSPSTDREQPARRRRARTRPEVAEETSPQQGKTILIVDDEPSIVALVSTTLRKNGYRVLEAADGPTALACAAQYPDAIDLLLSDVRMPGLAGTEVCRRLEQERPNIKCMLMSGYADGVEIRSWVFLPKPFTAPELLRRVREALEPACA
jgi:two-component system cell cycle sensor histidine kinase/response regulator CckA